MAEGGMNDLPKTDVATMRRVGFLGEKEVKGEPGVSTLGTE